MVGTLTIPEGRVIRISQVQYKSEAIVMVMTLVHTSSSNRRHISHGGLGSYDMFILLHSKEWISNCLVPLSNYAWLKFRLSHWLKLAHTKIENGPWFLILSPAVRWMKNKQHLRPNGHLCRIHCFLCKVYYLQIALLIHCTAHTMPICQLYIKYKIESIYIHITSIGFSLWICIGNAVFEFRSLFPQGNRLPN